MKHMCLDFVVICPLRATTALFSTLSHRATQAKLFLFSIYLVLFTQSNCYLSSHNYMLFDDVMSSLFILIKKSNFLKPENILQ